MATNKDHNNEDPGNEDQTNHDPANEDQAKSGATADDRADKDLTSDSESSGDDATDESAVDDADEPVEELTNEQRRQAAKAKLASALEADRRAAKRKKIIAITVTTVVVLAIAGTGTGLFLKKRADEREAARWTDCTYATDTEPKPNVPPVDPAMPADQKELANELSKQVADGLPKWRSAPKPDGRQLKEGEVKTVLTTSAGKIDMTLDRASAPCNVGAMTSLIENRYYNDTPCYRLTENEGRATLQCGDPTGIGIGNPGWNSPDEAPKGLKPSKETNPMMQTVTYPAGSVIIENDVQKPNTGNARFVIALTDIDLPASFALVGKVDKSSLDGTLKKVRDGGIIPGIDQNQQTGQLVRIPQVGKPKTPVMVTRAHIAS